MRSERLHNPPVQYPRTESEAEQDDRNLAELLQELRISGLGVQVLFGFGLLFGGLWFAFPLARRHR
jgi:hypothetical protein